MVRITRVYTRQGDDGSTALGTTARVAKDSPRVEAYGTVDELNSALGVVLTCELSEPLQESLLRIQNELFHLGSELCIPDEERERYPTPTLDERHVTNLESEMDEHLEQLPPLANFVLPGGCAAAAHLHMARTICRRAERRLVALAEAESLSAHLVRYLNRLSDALFVFARRANSDAEQSDQFWDSRA